MVQGGHTAAPPAMLAFGNASPACTCTAVAGHTSSRPHPLPLPISPDASPRRLPPAKSPLHCFPATCLPPPPPLLLWLPNAHACHAPAHPPPLQAQRCRSRLPLHSLRTPPLPPSLLPPPSGSPTSCPCTPPPPYTHPQPFPLPSLEGSPTSCPCVPAPAQPHQGTAWRSASTFAAACWWVTAPLL